MKQSIQIPAQWQHMSALFIALGDPHRQRILLAFEKNERLNILQIAEASTLSRTAVTHHLHVLRDSGALQSEKIGKEVFFWINKEFMVQTLRNVLNFVEAEI